ncbi:MAG TPA: hypothetical protein VJ886_08615 [Roseovarius sp.]|nr:hypothetical protein [Roseovarius sp.]
MLGILANTFRTATRTDIAAETRHRHRGGSHRHRAERLDPRREAELAAHLIARRRD